MKDYLHLFGGALAGIALLAAYIFAWSTLMRCHGAEADIQIVPIGDLQPKAAAHYVPQSGDRVVIGDGMEYVLVSAGDWARWTNAVARLEAVAERRWAREHETEAGRRAWHGAATNRVYSADGRTVTWLYRDGYAYVDEATPARRVSPAVKRAQSGPARPQSASKAAGGTGLPPRLEAKRRALEARPAAKEVNAVFGAGGKLLKVEDAK